MWCTHLVVFVASGQNCPGLCWAVHQTIRVGHLNATETEAEAAEAN